MPASSVPAAPSRPSRGARPGRRRPRVAAPRVEVPAPTFSVLLGAEHTGGRLSLTLVDAPVGSGAPLAARVTGATTYTVLEGRVRFLVGGATIDANVWDAVVVPARTPHAWLVAGEVPARLAVTAAPVATEPVPFGV
jgi:mannose-6-phosphate isomerase-like protein (cupin superfamily)